MFVLKSIAFLDESHIAECIQTKHERSGGINYRTVTDVEVVFRRSHLLHWRQIYHMNIFGIPSGNGEAIGGIKSHPWTMNVKERRKDGRNARNQENIQQRWMDVLVGTRSSLAGL